MPPVQRILHASAVAVADRGLLILGASGSGKSGLALQLMALGADLVADDRTMLTQETCGVRLSAPAAIRGMIEARGLGLLRARPVEAPLHLALDLDARETDRLPPWRETDLLGQRTRLLHISASPHFPAALMQYLRMGMTE
jgi:HPr kinase/phosphorylase